jgi:NTE family protein
VLAGGGARGAYEAGALSVLLPVLEDRGQRPTVFVGTSVGAINAAFLTATAHLDAAEACAALVEQWRSTRLHDLMWPLIPQTGWLLARAAAGLLPLPGVGLTGLLNPAPTARYLRRCIDWEQLRGNLDEFVEGLAVIATDIGRERAVVFCDGTLPAPAHRSHVLNYVPAKLTVNHIRASAAIPVLFPSVQVCEPPEVRGWYADGATRLNTPIKPVLDLGADRVLVVSTSAVRTAGLGQPWAAGRRPNLGDGAMNMLHSRLVDPLVEDMRALGDINAFYAHPDPAVLSYRSVRGKAPYRQIPYIFVGPKHRNVLGELAERVFTDHYRGVRGTLRSPELSLFGRIFGARNAVHSELFSYLFFAPEYVEELLLLGMSDATTWLQAPPGPGEPWQIDPLDALVHDPDEPAEPSTTDTPTRRAKTPVSGASS